MDESVKSFMNIKSPGHWVTDENGGLSAVFKTGFFRADIVVPEKELKSLYSRVFNAHSDLIGKIQDLDSDRLKVSHKGRNSLDFFALEPDNGTAGMEREVQKLERVKDFIHETLKNKTIEVTM